MILTGTRNSIIAFLFIPLLFACNRAIPASTSTNETEMETEAESFNADKLNRDILYHVNVYRQKKGLAALKTLSVANEQATIHSRNMALRKTAFSHNGFEERIAIISKSAGTMTAAAENVAYGNLTASAVVKGWINSAGHRKNLEGNYTLTGIGVYRDKKRVIFFTQLFMRR